MNSRVAFNETPNIAPDRSNNLRITENEDQNLGSVYNSVSTLEGGTIYEATEMGETAGVGFGPPHFREFDNSNYNYTQYQ